MKSKKVLDSERIDTIHQLGKEFSDATILMHEAIARKAGLSGSDHKYLGVIMQHGAMTAGAFSQLIGLTTGATTGLIDRLERVNLVRRKFDKSDRRKILIEPNPEIAAQLLGKVFGDLQKKMSSTLSKKFDENELEVLERYLDAMIGVMRKVTKKVQKQVE